MSGQIEYEDNLYMTLASVTVNVRSRHWFTTSDVEAVKTELRLIQREMEQRLLERFPSYQVDSKLST